MLNIFKRARPINTVALCMVALNSPELPTPEALQAYLRDQCPDLRDPVDIETTGEGDVMVMGVSMGESQGAVGLMPVPIPWSELEGPCQTAWRWPEATARMRAHKAHAVVTLLRRGDDIIENHLLVTWLAAGVAATTDCAGVYWGGGTLVHPPEMFIEQGREATRDGLPLTLWIDFRLQPMGDGKFRLLTTGMDRFSKMEIEFAPASISPDDLFNLGCNIANYVLTSGADIHDGHTIGRSATEKIRIRFARSMWDRPGQVMRLEM